ncbi:MAG: DUF362 domain-containing protein [Bryobacteraceae bacterium]|nr:DUF362 domain-containing protein [Bryobacteraceae bacterium]
MAQGGRTEGHGGLISPRDISRRRFLPSAATVSIAACGVAGSVACGVNDLPQPFAGVPSPVFIARAASYTANLAAILEQGIAACGLVVKGRNILLKPNLVEFDAATSINTNVAVVAAAVEVFQKLGASSVVIGEGPGHRRDTLYLAEEAGYRQAIAGFEQRFVDLNRDDVTPVARFHNLKEVYLPRTAVAADLIVSMAKMKTHHWAGATLSMKNFFGVVPGAVYGWPKNMLHQYGVSESIVELNRIFRKTFAIIDGIVGMEGNGPIQGTPRKAGVLVMGPDLVAVDATCCRVMGIDPGKVTYLNLGRHLGHVPAGRIEQRGETVGHVYTPFELIAEQAQMRLAEGTSTQPETNRGFPGSD